MVHIKRRYQNNTAIYYNPSVDECHLICISMYVRKRQCIKGFIIKAGYLQIQERDRMDKREKMNVNGLFFACEGL